MDKYEFNIKVEQIKKLVNKGDYETAMKIADTIDWKRVRSTSLLSMVAQVYERNDEYQEAKDILLLAFERAPIGKRLLFKLTELALKEGNVNEAEAYYREFCDLAGDDPRQYLLRYLILEAKDATLEQLITSLERYTTEELDEKWLYKLAELYQKVGRQEDCVATCDKIMLLFGLGKYVDKAMELKIQFAPLTNYQMDLVENRDKYEAKLKEVEQKFDKHVGIYQEPAEEYYDSEDEMEDGPQVDEEIVARLHENEVQRNLAEEMSRLSVDEDQDEPLEENYMEETRVLGNIRDIKDYRQQAYAEQTSYAQQERQDEALQKSYVPPMTASYETEEDSYAAAAQTAATAVEDDDDGMVVEDWDMEPEETELNHLMIESEDPVVGLEMALECLKKIHRELRTKSTVAKITGEKLNRRGIFAVVDKLAGKDLVIEHAADLSDNVLQELSELMDRDATGIIVVLIDTPARIEYLHNSYPGLAGKFQCIGCENRESADNRSIDEIEMQRSLEQQTAVQERIAKETVGRQEAPKRPAEGGTLSARAGAGIEERRRPECQSEYQPEHRSEYQPERRSEYQPEHQPERQSEYQPERRPEYQPERQLEHQPERQLEHRSEYQSERQIEHQSERQLERRPERGYQEPAERRAEPQPKPARTKVPTEEPVREDPSGVMDVEEFAQYACKYASEIDCSITGKSLLALYERVEMMEEDGVELTREAAEDLIEEAADKAEKPSFGGRIKGLFSAKYDKEGLLILKEQHFFD